MFCQSFFLFPRYINSVLYVNIHKLCSEQLHSCRARHNWICFLAYSKFLRNFQFFQLHFMLLRLGPRLQYFHKKNSKKNFAPENMKKTTSKITHNRPHLFLYCQLAHTSPAHRATYVLWLWQYKLGCFCNFQGNFNLFMIRYRNGQWVICNSCDMMRKSEIIYIGSNIELLISNHEYIF